MKKRKEFTLEERQYIHVMLGKGKGFRELGEVLDRDPKVIKRVATRYKSKNPFVYKNQTALERAKWDHDEHQKRLRSPKARKRLKTLERQRYVESRLKKASPELISGRYKKSYPKEKMSPESIYQWIYKERQDLTQYLEIVSQRGNRKRSSNRKYRYKEPAATKRSISDRPEEANNRTGILHLESDTVMGIKSSKACIHNTCDRKSRAVMLDKLHECTAQASSIVTNRRLKVLPEELREKMTMTEDNGAENSNFAEEERILKIKHFSCHPYSAWERGTVEKLNRSAIRRFFPKGTDFTHVTFDQIKQAETFHNNRPMKCLGFKTPLEVLAADLKKHNLTPAILGLVELPW